MTTETDEAALRILENMRRKRHVHKIIPDSDLWYIEFARRLLADRERAEPGMVSVPRDFLAAIRPAVKRYEQQAQQSLLKWNRGEYPEHYGAMLKDEATRQAALFDQLEAMLSAPPAAPSQDALDGKRRAKIEAFRKLGNNWNSYGCPPFSVASIEAALKLEPLLPAEFSYVVPCADGGVMFSNEGEETTIEIYSDAALRGKEEDHG